MNRVRPSAVLGSRHVRLGTFGRHALGLTGLVALLTVLPLTLGTTWMSVGVVAGIFALAVIGLELQYGLAGQISLGQNAFVAVGAFATAILTVKANIPPVVALFAGMLVAGILATAIGAVTVRLDEAYMAMATLGFGLMVSAAALALRDLTGGASGIAGIAPFHVGSIGPRGEVQTYVFSWGLVILAMVVALRMAGSRVGLAWRIIAVHPEVAAACGVGVASRKLQVFVLSAMFGSVAGTFYAHYASAITAEGFGVALIVTLLVMQIFGGLGTVYGAAIGAIAGELVTVFAGSRGRDADLFFGAIFLALLFFVPGGIAAVVRRGLARLRPAAELNTTEIDRAFHPERMRGFTAGLVRIQELGRPVLEVRGVTKRFGGLVALEDVALTVTAGQMHGIVGANGAGKSTLLNVICGIHRSTSGDVLWHGQSITAWSTERRAGDGIARTFQTPRMAGEMTVFENVLIGAYSGGWLGLAAAVATPLEAREFDGLKDRTRDILRAIGLDGVADQPTARLSFGERRLVELARALVMKPRVLCLDESTSGLGQADKDHFCEFLRALAASGVAICLVEHDTNLVRDTCDWVTVLDRGKVIADGPGESIFDDPRVVASYMGEVAVVA